MPFVVLAIALIVRRIRRTERGVSGRSAGFGARQAAAEMVCCARSTKWTTDEGDGTGRMSLAMPKPKADVLARRVAIAADLRAIVPGEGVVADPEELRPFESDGLTAYRQMPMLVVLPETVDQVSRVLRYCYDNGIRVVPRGSGTSLSGGALPLEDGVLLVMSKFNKVLDIDFDNRCVVVQPGVTNLGVTNAVVHRGFYYAPDPSSQIACSIGGNVAENSGGVHCLKYGLTANNVLGIEMVLITGEVIRLGGKHLDTDGYDLLGLMTGSEGLLGVVTEVTVRILRSPETARAVLIGFASSEDGGRCVADIIGAGIIPGGMEMMDRPAIHAAEDFVHAGYPRRRGGAADRRARRPAARGLASPGARRADRRGEQCGQHPRLQQRGGAAVLLGRTQGGLPRRRAHLARLLLHGRHDPAKGAAARAAPACASCRSSTGCASPTSSMPATATCTRSSSTTRTSRTSWRRPRPSARTSCGSASRSAAC